MQDKSYSEENFFCKKYGGRNIKDILFCGRNIYFCETNLSLQEKYIFCKTNLILREKYIFAQKSYFLEEIYFCETNLILRENYTFC